MTKKYKTQDVTEVRKEFWEQKFKKNLKRYFSCDNKHENISFTLDHLNGGIDELVYYRDRLAEIAGVPKTDIYYFASGNTSYYDSIYYDSIEVSHELCVTRILSKAEQIELLKIRSGERKEEEERQRQIKLQQLAALKKELGVE